MRTVTLARKPFTSTVSECVAAHGCGGLNIDGCRIEGIVPRCTGQGFRTGKYGGVIGHGETTLDGVPWANIEGRWPANVLMAEGVMSVDAGEQLTKFFKVIPG